MLSITVAGARAHGRTVKQAEGPGTDEALGGWHWTRKRGRSLLHATGRAECYRHR